MIRSMLPFAGIALLFGGALIGAIANVRPSTYRVAPFAFSSVQEAVTKQKSAHIIFRMVPEDASLPVVKYETWLSTDAPAYAVQTPEGRLVGNHNGVWQSSEGQPGFLLIKEPVTRALIQKEMLLSRFEIDPRNAPSIRWEEVATKKAITSRTLIQFVSDDSGVHRVLWVDPDTHLPMRLDGEMHGDFASQDASPAPRAGTFHVIYYYGRNLPDSIFETPNRKKPVRGR